MAFRAALCLVAGVAGWALRTGSPEVSVVCFGVAYVAGAWDLARSVAGDLREFRFDTEFLMLLVAVGASVIGAWAEGALLLVLFSSSAAMEEFASGRTQREISALLKGAPKVARRIQDGVEQEVTVESLVPGELVRVTANEQIPVDLEIVRGESACDESTLTGEADPVPKRAGDSALAGTLNLWGVVEGRVVRAAGDSALQRIIRLIHEAQNQRAPIQRFTDRFGTRYTALVVGACIAWFFISWRVLDHPPFIAGGEVRSAFYRAMTLLVVLSPCALVLSVPSAILSAIACGARHGVLFRGGAAVETLSEKELAVFLQLASGRSVQQVAEDFRLSPSTVGTHLYHIKQKLNVQNAAELALVALRNSGSGAQLISLGIVTILLAPLAEELLFRGILYPAAKQLGFPRAALWGTSVLFAAIHFKVAIFIPLLLLALLLVWLYEKTDNLLAPIAAHVTFNAVNFALFFIAKDFAAKLPGQS